MAVQVKSTVKAKKKKVFLLTEPKEQERLQDFYKTKKLPWKSTVRCLMEVAMENKAEPVWIVIPNKPKIPAH